MSLGSPDFEGKEASECAMLGNARRDDICGCDVGVWDREEDAAVYVFAG